MWVVKEGGGKSVKHCVELISFTIGVGYLVSSLEKKKERKENHDRLRVCSSLTTGSWSGCRRGFPPFPSSNLIIDLGVGVSFLLFCGRERGSRVLNLTPTLAEEFGRLDRSTWLSK